MKLDEEAKIKSNNYIKFNINDKARVKLNEHGKEIFNNYFNNKLILLLDKDGYYSDNLWSIMSMFGPYLYNGGKIPFVKNSLEILKE